MRIAAKVTEPIEQITAVFPKQSIVRLLLFAIFMVGLAARLYYLDSSTFIAERQFRSALLARDYYYDLGVSVPEWQRQVAATNVTREGGFEPPFLEKFVSYLYLVSGGERLWIPRLLSSIFWLIGGVFLYRLSRRLVSGSIALFPLAYFLFLPLGIHVSISFLPDPLMIMLLLASLLVIVRYMEQPSRERLIVAAVVSGAAILAKPFSLFVIQGGFAAVALCGKGTWRERVTDLLIFGLVSLFLGALYYLYGVFVEGFLQAHTRQSILPYLLLRGEYWRGWLSTATEAVGYFPLLAALVGLPFIRRAGWRALLVGLWVGYIGFCLFFTYHIRFAGHYHLQLAVIVALSIGPLAATVLHQMMKVITKWYWWLPPIAALFIVALFTFRELRQIRPRYEDPALAREIGELVEHSTETVFIASYYGRPLEYFGHLSGQYWPRRADTAFTQPGGGELSVDERLTAIGFSPQYFIITNFGEFNAHHGDLRQYLEINCSIMKESDQYLIYSDCSE